MQSNKTIYNSSSEQDTKEIGFNFASQIKPHTVVVLSGPLGSGKTQFVQGVACGLSIKDTLSSPTFNIVYEYEGFLTSEKKSITLYHFDLYRLENPSELEDIDFYGIVESQGVSFIEWGDKFIDQMPRNYIRIDFKKTGQNSRRITFINKH